MLKRLKDLRPSGVNGDGFVVTRLPRVRKDASSDLAIPVYYSVNSWHISSLVLKIELFRLRY